MARTWTDALASTPLLQPDRFSCGAAVAVVSRALTDESGAQALLGQGPSFRERVLATHRALTSSRHPRGSLRLGWPSRLGTPPWSLKHHLEVSTGLRHDVVWARCSRDSALLRAARALEAGHTVPIYLGNARLPRHVVLALPPTYGPTGHAQWAVYEPAYGVARKITVADFLRARITDCAWPVPWFVVVPRISPAPRSAPRRQV